MSEQTAKTEADVKIGDTVNIVGPDGVIQATVGSVADLFGGGKLVDVSWKDGSVTHARYDAEGKQFHTWHWPA